MERTRKPDADPETLPDRPGLAGQDWEALDTPAADAEQIFENGDMRYDDEPDGELPGENDDNPYEESDDALPEDKEEGAITESIESDDET